MAGIAEALTRFQARAVLKALGLASWREVRSFRSIAGQNFFLFVLLVAYQQPESAEFFFVILVVLVLFPLSADAMEKIPFERRVTWPISRTGWSAIRAGSFAFNPIAWLGIVLLLRMGWRMSVVAVMAGAVLESFVWLVKRFIGNSPDFWQRFIPAPPGAFGALMRLQWREMLSTLDPYLALTLMACTVLYRSFGTRMDPAAPRILSLLVVLAMSTQSQVLFGVDGAGAERYRLLPLTGWQVLLAKDVAFLSLVAILVAPLDFVSGFAGSVAVLAIGHHRSVMKPVPQLRWRFTAGALVPDGLIQVGCLFAVGLQVRSMMLPLLSLCGMGWLASLLFYGWQWDRRRHVEADVLEVSAAISGDVGG